MLKKRIICLILSAVLLIPVLAACDSGKQSSDSSGINADASVVALEGSFETIQATLNAKGVTAIKVLVYSEDHEDGACLGLSELPNDSSESPVYTVLVNHKSYAQDLEQDRLVPRIIEKKSYDEKIAKPISSNESLKKTFDAFYTLYDPKGDNTEAEVEKMQKEYPYTLTGNAIYALDSSVKDKELKDLEAAIKENTDYSFEDLLADYTTVQVIPTLKSYLKADVITEENSEIEETAQGLVINSYKGTSGAVLVPATISGKDVYGLGEGAFSSSYVHSVVIEEGVKNIASKAFARASGLTSLVLPSTIEGIGDGAFGSPVFTKSENGYKTIFEDILLSYTGTETQIKIPDTIKHIGGAAFRQNNKITKVIFPKSLESIGDQAFYKCTSLTSADISGTAIKRVGNEAFASNSKLENIAISDKVTSVGNKAFFECGKVQTLKLGASIVTIGDDAFNNLVLIDNITLPSTLTHLGDRAFYKCRAMKNLSGGENVVEAGKDVFSETLFYNQLKAQGDLGVFGKGVLVTYTGKDTEVTIPDNIVYISSAFLDNKAVKSITIPSSVTGICNEAFESCGNLAKVTIPASVTFIGDHIFNGTSTDLTVKVESGSVAEQYCKDNHIKTE